MFNTIVGKIDYIVKFDIYLESKLLCQVLIILMSHVVDLVTEYPFESMILTYITQ